MAEKDLAHLHHHVKALYQIIRGRDCWVQVVMDIVGCLVTCMTCNLLLNQLAGVLPIS